MPPIVTTPVIDDLPTNLEELQAEVNQVYAPSRSVPAQIPEELLGLLDRFHQKLLGGCFALQDLIDIEGMPRAALELVLREVGVPIPSFATTAQVRQLARDAGYINRFRNAPAGWEKYLQDVAPIGVTVNVTGSTISNIFFSPNIVAQSLPSYKELATAGTAGDKTPYLLGAAHFSHEVVVVLSGHGNFRWWVIPGYPDESFQEFVKASAKYFVPMMSDSTTITVILDYI